MATRSAIPVNWTVKQSGTGPHGPVTVWTNTETGEEIMLPIGQQPDSGTLALLAMNGAEVPAALNERDEFEDAEIPEETALDRVLQALNTASDNPDSRAEVRIYRIPDDGQEVYCAKFTPEEFEEKDLDLIRIKFGPGTYKVRVMGKTPKFDAQGQPIKFGGRFVRLTNQTVIIAPSLEPVRQTESPQNQQSDLIVTRLMDRLEKLETKGSSGDMLQQLQMFKMMQDVFGSGGKAGAQKSLVEQMEDMNRLKQVAKELNGEDSGSSDGGLMGMGSKLLEIIGPAIAAGNQQPAHAQAVPMVAIPASLATAQPQPPQINPLPTSQPEAEDVNAFEKLAVNAMVKTLVKQAAANGDIEPQAEFLYEKMPEEVFQIMELPQWFDVLGEMYPEVKPHQEWFTKLRDRILEIAQEPEDDNE